MVVHEFHSYCTSTEWNVFFPSVKARILLGTEAGEQTLLISTCALAQNALLYYSSNGIFVDKRPGKVDNSRPS